MSFAAVITCDCGPECDAVAIVDFVHTDSEARIALHRKGWDCDTVRGGTTVDAAPGHELPRGVS